MRRTPPSSQGLPAGAAARQPGLTGIVTQLDFKQPATQDAVLTVREAACGAGAGEAVGVVLSTATAAAADVVGPAATPAVAVGAAVGAAAATGLPREGLPDVGLSGSGLAEDGDSAGLHMHDQKVSRRIVIGTGMILARRTVLILARRSVLILARRTVHLLQLGCSPAGMRTGIWSSTGVRKT